MKAANDLHEALKKIFDNGSEVIPVTVTSVDKAACTCDVEYDGLELGEVRLKATNEDKQGFKIFPQVGSAVLIQKLGKTEEYFVAMYSEIDEVETSVEDTVVKVNADGFHFGKGNVSLRDVLDDLFGQVKAINSELQKVVVTIGVTPNVVALQGINTQLENNRTKAKEILK